MKCACLYIIRGIPGSGKSTLAKKLVDNSRHREADMYHIIDGVYKYKRENVKASHEWCINEVEQLMKECNKDIAVSNTFIKYWEYKPYIKLANKYNYKVVIIECHADFGNVHNVPQHIVKRMMSNFEPHNYHNVTL